MTSPPAPPASTIGTVGAAPTPPGSLTAAPDTAQAFAYINALDQWVAGLRNALDALDASAQLAKDPGAYTQDIVLAMSLWNSIETRRVQLHTAWDSGRVGPNELATIATLIWGRLTDPLGNPSAFTLPEACTLAAALQDRLTAVLSHDAIAGSGAAARIGPLRDAIVRCRRQAEALGIPTRRIDDLSTELERAITGSDPNAIAATVARIDNEITLTERDLIKEASTRAGFTFQSAEVRRRHDELLAKTREVETVAQRCNDKIADPPRIAIPSIVSLGPPPSAQPSGDQQVWDAARQELTEYAAKLGRCAVALAEAEARYRAPLDERDDLRGLLGSYRNRAAVHGLAEDAALDDDYRAAASVLMSAPCDLGTGRTLVARYQEAVRVAVGAATVTEPRESP